MDEVSEDCHHSPASTLPRCAALLCCAVLCVAVNGISFAPHSFGLMLACACSDGTVTVCTRREADGRWEQQQFMAHKGGANAISWGPDVKVSSTHPFPPPHTLPLSLSSSSCPPR